MHKNIGRARHRFRIAVRLHGVIWRAAKTGYRNRYRAGAGRNDDDIQKFLIGYVAHFVQIAAGKKFNPHVTIGVGTITYLKTILAEPDAFAFSPAGASVYQLGSFGTARKELNALVLTP